MLPAKRGAKRREIDPKDCEIPITFPWISSGAFNEIVLKAFVHASAPNAEARRAQMAKGIKLFIKEQRIKMSKRPPVPI